MTAPTTETTTPPANGVRPGGIIFPHELDWPAIRDRVAARMRELDLNQKALAVKSRFSQGGLSEFLSAKRAELDLATFDAIARALATTVQDLAGIEIAAAGQGGAGLVWLRHNQLRPSAANPRKTFDEEKTAALAASIKGRDAVLQPLVVGRDIDTTGARPITLGERRWRAVGILIEAGRWPADRPLPCVARDDFDDAETLADAVVENAQREDLPPLEEAQAFHRLIHEFQWTTERIAEAIGKTQRHVQIRLSLVEKLAEPVQQALKDGRITMAAARVLTMAPEPRQIEAAKAIERGDYGYQSAENIKRNLLHSLIPLGRNAFKLEQWTGELVADADDPDKRYFDDRAQFIRLQRDAAEARRMELEKQWAWAILDDETDEDNEIEDWRYRADKDAKDAGAIVRIDYDDLSVEVLTHQVLDSPKTLDKPSSAAPAATGKVATKPAPKPSAAITQAHMVKCRKAKTAALQTTLATRPGVAMRAVVLALMTRGNSDVKLGYKASDRDDHVAVPALDTLTARFVGPFRGLPGRFAGKEYLAIDSWETGAEAKAWEILCALPDDDVAGMLAVLVARAVGSWNGYRSELGDPPLALALAGTLAIDMAEHVALDEDWLKSCRKTQLLQITRALNADHDLRDILVGELVTLILADAEHGTNGYVPPSLRFGTPDEIANLIDGGDGA